MTLEGLPGNLLLEQQISSCIIRANEGKSNFDDRQKFMQHFQ